MRYASWATSFLLGIGSAWAAEIAEGSVPTFIVHEIDGVRTKGSLKSIGDDGSMELDLGDQKTKAISAARHLKLEQESTLASRPSKNSFILLPEGDRIENAEIEAILDETIQVQSKILGAVSLPIDAVTDLVVAPPSDADSRAALLEDLRLDDRKSEVVRLLNGDQIQGTILGLSPKSVRLKTGNAEVDLNRAEVEAIGFDPTLINYPRPEGAWWEVGFTDGTRLGVSELRLVDGQIHARSRFGEAFNAALADVVRIRCRRPELVYLSESTPLKVQYVPFIGPVLPYRSDMSVDGQPMSLAGISYDRGVGTESRTLLAYRLTPEDRRFQANVGVDDRAGPLGSVIFRVLIDGKERFASPPMSSGDTPLEIDLELHDAKFLILATEFGQRGNTRDLADWAEARLIRQQD